MTRQTGDSPSRARGGTRIWRSHRGSAMLSRGSGAKEVARTARCTGRDGTVCKSATANLAHRLALVVEPERPTLVPRHDGKDDATRAPHV